MRLNFQPAINMLNLLAVPSQEMVKNWNGRIPVSDIQVAEIDPRYMGGTDLCNYYGISFESGANCIIVEGIRGTKINRAACLVPVNSTKTDFNGLVRKHLNARTVSLIPLEHVVNLTNMEYGSITVFGLPFDFQILIDSKVMLIDKVIIGSGLQKSKLLLPTAALLDLPNAMVIEGLCF